MKPDPARRRVRATTSNGPSSLAIKWVTRHTASTPRMNSTGLIFSPHTTREKRLSAQSLWLPKIPCCDGNLPLVRRSTSAPLAPLRLHPTASEEHPPAAVWRRGAPRSDYPLDQAVEFGDFSDRPVAHRCPARLSTVTSPVRGQPSIPSNPASRRCCSWASF